MSDKRYTAQEMRDTADAMSHSCDSELVVADADECGLHINRNKTFDVASMLRQAADMIERCEKLRFNMIPHKHDSEIVDYILRGDAGKEK